MSGKISALVRTKYNSEISHIKNEEKESPKQNNKLLIHLDFFKVKLGIK